MDANNSKAMDVGEQGVEAAVKHMFTDQETGKQLYLILKCVACMDSLLIKII